MSMARRARIQLSDLLQHLSDDEWAEGSDDHLGMDEEDSYSSDDIIIFIALKQ